MVKVIAGLKGSGKTKQLIGLVDEALEKENGDVVVIERGTGLLTDINHRARLIDTDDYPITGYHTLEGFVSGMNAANFDITHIFFDNLTKIVSNDDTSVAATFLAWLEGFSKDHEVDFTLTLSLDAASLPETIKKYM